MSDTLNPVDNFFNGTISTDGVDLGGRTPEFANQLGFDRDRLSVPEATIPNGATGASVCLGTNGDTYFFGGIAFDTLIRAPNLQIDKTRPAPQTADPATWSPTRPRSPTRRRPARRRPSRPPTWWSTTRCPSGLDFAGFADNPAATLQLRQPHARRALHRGHAGAGRVVQRSPTGRR